MKGAAVLRHLGVVAFDRAVGLKVRMTTDVTLRSGKTITKGTDGLFIAAHWRGRFTLYWDGSKGDVDVAVRNLDASSFEVVR